MTRGHKRSPSSILSFLLGFALLGGMTLIVFILIRCFYAPVSPPVGAADRQGVVIGVALITFSVLIGLINFADNCTWISRLTRRLRHPPDRVGSDPRQAHAEVLA